MLEQTAGYQSRIHTNCAYDALENRHAGCSRVCERTMDTWRELVRVCASRHSHGISYVLRSTPFWHPFRLLPRLVAHTQFFKSCPERIVFTRVSAMKKQIFYSCHFFQSFIIFITKFL